MQKKPRTVKPGVVHKIIKPIVPSLPEKAEITVEGADHLFREIRIVNSLEDPHGKEVKLKQGAHVDVVVEAEPDATVPKEANK